MLEQTLAPERLRAPTTRQLATIMSVATELPVGRVTNAELAQRLGVSEDWILSRTGIRERRRAAPEERLSDYAARAGRAALANARGSASDGLTLEDIDVFVYHQANARITRAVGERLGLHPERVVECIEMLGNASAATLPVALAEAQRDGLLRPGARVLVSAFGAGFTWGAGVIEWGGGSGDA